MSCEDSVETTDENGTTIEYVPIDRVRIAFIHGMFVGILLISIAVISGNIIMCILFG